MEPKKELNMLNEYRLQPTHARAVNIPLILIMFSILMHVRISFFHTTRTAKELLIPTHFSLLKGF